MVNQEQEILIQRIDKINDDQCLCHSLHHDIVVDDNHKLNEVILPVQLSKITYKINLIYYSISLL